MATFTLDTSTLGGADFNYAENPEINDRGRSIMVQWDQSGLNQDMELFGYSIRYLPAEETAKELS
jgi:hypothetical protein